MTAEEKNEKFSGITSKLGLQPQEAPSLLKTKESKLYIGIPKETFFQEHRIPLTPEAVKLLVNRGHRIVIETGAGEDSYFEDIQYSEAGAEIVDSVKQVYKANIILKVAPLLSSDCEYVKQKQIIISPLHFPTIEETHIRTLMGKQVTALAVEFINDNDGTFPFVRAMSEIAGYSSVLIAGELLSSSQDGLGILLGGISGVPSAKVVILGAGAVGTNAARAALGMGAVVKVFDDKVYKLIRLQSEIGQRLYTSVLSPEILSRELEEADVLIGAIHSKDGRCPIVVTEHMIEGMKKGSVVIDVSIDQGGCVETSKMTSLDEPTFMYHDVIHYAVPNISAKYSQTASKAFSNILTPKLIQLGENNSLQSWLKENKGMRNGTYLYQGKLCSTSIADKLDMQTTNLDLLFAASTKQ